MTTHCAEGVAAPGQLLDDAERALRRDPGQSIEILADVAAHLQRVPNDLLLGRMLTLRAEAELARGEMSRALISFQAARTTWLAAGRPLEARGSMLGRTDILLGAGEYEDVIALVGRIRTGLEEGGVDDEDLATRLHLRAHRQLGTAHAATGTMSTAMRHFDLAEDLAHTLADDHETATVQLLRGEALLVDGLLHRALDLMVDARRTFLRVGSRPAAARAVLRIASVLTVLGAPMAALALGERIREEVGDRPSSLGECEVVRAAALLAAGLVEEALPAAVRARDLFRRAGALSRCARAELVSAQAAAAVGRHDLAAESLLAAERLSSDCGDAMTRDRARLLMARHAFARDDRATVLQLGRKVVEASTTAAVVVEAQTLLARASDDRADAEALIAAASARVDHAGRPELRVELRLARARHLRQSDQVPQALAELRAACDLGDRLLRRGATRGQSHGAFAEASDELIDLLLADGSHSALIEAWQRVRLVKDRMLATQGAGARDWQVDDAPGQHEDLDLLIARMRERNDLLGAPTMDLTVPEGPFVEYYVRANDVLAFVIREGQVHLRRLGDVAQETAQLATRWQQECLLVAAAGTTTGDSVALDTAYACLVEPLSDLLVDVEAEPVEVAAHRHLLSLPFDAMLDVGGPWRERLVADAWAESAADVTAPQARFAPPAVLVLAVPDAAAPAILDEARMIARTLPTAEVHEGPAATAACLSERLSGADLVHIAAHGRFRPGNPHFSALRLGDGWLTAADLLSGRFDLTGRVVVLSACGSGRGSGQMPQPVGLAWACLGAGAAGVVASLWPIDDDVTASLMTEFYRGLALGEDPRHALGRARRVVAAAHPHPYFWAAFRFFAPS